MLRAIRHGASSIDAVELDPRIVEVMTQQLADFTGDIYSQPGVTLHVAEARAFVARSQARYDLVQVALVDGFGAAAAGLHALDENYLYTVEAFGRYLERLSDGGLLAITRWNRLPPRDSLRLVATARAALEASGIGRPADHVVLVRGWKTHTLLVKRRPFDERERAACNAGGWNALSTIRACGYEPGPRYAVEYVAVRLNERRDIDWAGRDDDGHVHLLHAR